MRQTSLAPTLLGLGLVAALAGEALDLILGVLDALGDGFGGGGTAGELPAGLAAAARTGRITRAQRADRERAARGGGAAGGEAAAFAVGFFAGMAIDCERTPTR